MIVISQWSAIAGSSTDRLFCRSATECLKSRALQIRSARRPHRLRTGRADAVDQALAVCDKVPEAQNDAHRPICSDHPDPGDLGQRHVGIIGCASRTPLGRVRRPRLWRGPAHPGILCGCTCWTSSRLASRICSVDLRLVRAGDHGNLFEERKRIERVLERLPASFHEVIAQRVEPNSEVGSRICGPDRALVVINVPTRLPDWRLDSLRKRPIGTMAE